VQARPPAANDGAAGLDLELDLERECEPEREPDGAALEGPDDLRDWPAAPPGGPAAWPPIPPGKGRG
jgi:hypothetical protein